MKCIKALLAFIAPLGSVIFIYWVGGGEFERSPDLAVTFLFGFAMGIFAVAVASAEGRLD